MTAHILSTASRLSEGFSIRISDANTIQTGWQVEARPGIQLAQPAHAEMLGEGMSRTVYSTSEAVDVAIDLMTAVYAFPPPNMPSGPWLVDGYDIRALRRELRLSYAGLEASQLQAIEGLVIDLAVFRHRPVVLYAQRRSAVASVISLLYTLADVRLSALLSSHLTQADFDRLDPAAQLICGAPLTLVEVATVYGIADFLDLESASDSAAALVFDHPVAEHMRRQQFRSAQPIICPSGPPERPACKKRTR